MRLAPPVVDVERRDDGALVLRSPQPLAPYARCVGEWLERWGDAKGEATFLAERDDLARGTDWRRVTYGQARDAARGIGAGLLALGASATRPVMLLSDNAVDHQLVQLGAMHAGVPAAPISPAYSLVARDFTKLRAIAAQVAPSVVYCDDRAPFAAALAALALDVPVMTRADVAELARTKPDDRFARAHAAVGPDTVAKVLFTSGSTGTPKGVVNTQRMLCSNQQAIAQCWPFLDDRPPVVVDWLPWSHTFGGNHNVNMVLRSGGTLYVDAGKPAPGRFDVTLANLREVSPTAYFNVPRGFEMLAAALEKDDDLARRFFADLDLVFYAGAALPQSTWDRLERVRDRAGASRVLFVSAWGATETSPLVTSVHFPIPRAGVIGLPAPGCELKLAPSSTKLEMRVRGPNVTPGYWMRGGGVAPLAVDDEGFWPTGDAGKLADPGEPARGVVFDGRTAENFKLTSGTWVAVGELRLAVIARCAPLVSDAVVAGHDRDAIGLLLFCAPTELDATALRARLAAALAEHNAAHPGSSTRVARAVVLAEPPSIDAGEITDKGYVNQRAVLERRAATAERLYGEAPDADVIVVS
jgi:feruloyl-CoA synthase